MFVVFLLSLLWPIPLALCLAAIPILAIFGVCDFFGQLCFGERQKCCGIDFRSILCCGRRKTATTTTVQDEESGGVVEENLGVIDRPPGRDDMELPSYLEAVASRG